MSLLNAFELLGQSPLGLYMQQSTYAFEVAEMAHLLGLAGLGGGVLIIDLRVLGIGLKSQPAARLAQDLMPYLVGCLCTSVATGFLLLAAEPVKCYYHPAFRVKMALLGSAVLFSAFIQPRKLNSKTMAVISLLIWFSVGLAGRAIGVI